ncbi:hypothetical protein BDW72DRAFT_208620 [Aspergillus terricola var. indicus]
MSNDFGFLLPNGTRIVHGPGAATRDAFPPEVEIPGRLQTFSGGHMNDPATTPCFCGPQGLLPFDTETRMPRHVHMAPDKSTGNGRLRYVVEKIMVMEGVAVAELGGELYVIPPHTLVLIGAGVPHTWTACPRGIDFGALGFPNDDGENVVSTGRFIAVFEYEAPTSFFPTAQTNTLTSEEEYVRCDDLHSLRIPGMTAEEIKERAWFVWGKGARKLALQSLRGSNC